MQMQRTPRVRLPPAIRARQMEMRCGCTVDGKVGQRVLEPCEHHLEWMKALVRAEREECASLADLQAALDRRKGETFAKMGLDDDATAQSYEDFAVTAESIARAIRFRGHL